MKGQQKNNEKGKTMKQEQLSRRGFVAFGATALLTAFSGITLVPSEAQAATSGTVALQFDATARYDMAKEIFDLVNKERTNAGKKAVVYDATLTEYAMQRAAELFVYMDSGHNRPNGEACKTIAAGSVYSGYTWENAAGGHTTASATMAGWMESLGHQQNILRSQVSCVGVGVVEHEGHFNFIQIFGLETAVDSALKSNTTKTFTIDTLPNKITLSGNPGSRTLKVGSEGSYTVDSIYLYNGFGSGFGYCHLNTSAVNFSSSSATIAKVDATGKVTAVSPGGTTVTKEIKGATSFSQTDKVTVLTAATDLSTLNVSTGGTELSYTGSTAFPSLTIKDGNYTLVRNTDYALSGIGKAVGSYTLEIVGEGSYAGTVKVPYSIKAVEEKTAESKTTQEANQVTTQTTKINMSKTSVSSINQQTYTGKVIKPGVTVKSGGKTLKNGTDYSLSYSNNTKTGKATVKITGKGNYTGAKNATFIIKPKKNATPSVSVGKKKATIKYSDPGGSVSGYQIGYWCSGKGWKYTTASGKSKAISGLASKKKYAFKVRAYKIIDNKKYYGAWSNEKKGTIK